LSFKSFYHLLLINYTIISFLFQQSASGDKDNTKRRLQSLQQSMRSVGAQTSQHGTITCLLLLLPILCYLINIYMYKYRLV